jgi:hypothetical protein
LFAGKSQGIVFEEHLDGVYRYDIGLESWFSLAGESGSLTSPVCMLEIMIQKIRLCAASQAGVAFSHAQITVASAPEYLLGRKS